MMRKLAASFLALGLSGCGTMVSYQEAAQASEEYRREIALICQLPDDYGALIDSRASREAWRKEAERAPGLERLAGVWAFEERRRIDTREPYLAKAVVIPVAAVNPVQARQKVGEHVWGCTLDGRYSVKCQGSRGYVLAFFHQ